MANKDTKIRGKQIRGRKVEGDILRYTNGEFIPSSSLTDLEATSEAAHGIPAGGLAGEVLTKMSGDSYDAGWQRPTGGGGGGGATPGSGLSLDASGNIALGGEITNPATQLTSDTGVDFSMILLNVDGGRSWLNIDSTREYGEIGIQDSYTKEYSSVWVGAGTSGIQKGNIQIVLNSTDINFRGYASRPSQTPAKYLGINTANNLVVADPPSGGGLTADEINALIDAKLKDYLPLSGGTMTGDVEMDGHRITNANINGVSNG